MKYIIKTEEELKKENKLMEKYFQKKLKEKQFLINLKAFLNDMEKDNPEDDVQDQNNNIMPKNEQNDVANRKNV